MTRNELIATASSKDPPHPLKDVAAKFYEWKKTAGVSESSLS